MLPDSYTTLMYFHLATVVPCILLGPAQFFMKKGSPVHKTIGKVYMILMLITATITLFMPAQVGPTLANHFGFIHGFSLLALYSVPKAYFAARRGDLKSHQGSMIGLYVGGIIIAGGFTLAPGRFLHQFFFG